MCAGKSLPVLEKGTDVCKGVRWAAMPVLVRGSWSEDSLALCKCPPHTESGSRSAQHAGEEELPNRAKNVAVNISAREEELCAEIRLRLLLRDMFAFLRRVLATWFVKTVAVREGSLDWEAF